MIKLADNGNCWRRLNRENFTKIRLLNSHVQIEPNKVTSRNQESRSFPHNETAPAILTKDQARYRLSAKNTYYLRKLPVI